MALPQDVTQLTSADISRFRRLSEYLEDSSFNWTKVPFTDWEKFKKMKLAYKSYHIAPPKALFVLGSNWRILNEGISISFGGTVSPTADGFQLAEFLAQQAVKQHGAIIVAGGVVGVDMAAHLGALDERGKTVAVLSNPVILGLHPYIPKRTFLEEGIVLQGGLLVSEYDTPLDDRKERLLQRDRVITALSDYFVAVECSSDSGTVDAAKRAKIQKTKVIVIDWSRIEKTWHKPKNDGAQQLIQENVADEIIPRKPVLNIRDPNLLRDFHAVLSGCKVN